jgi:hypothetical protein
MMNRVLANEEYGDITFKHETIEPEPINPEGANKFDYPVEIDGVEYDEDEDPKYIPKSGGNE